MPAPAAASSWEPTKCPAPAPRSLLQQVKDVLSMAIGRDDDEDYECAHG